MKSVTASEMRELDRRTIDEAGISGEVLMSRAGYGVAEAVSGMLATTARDNPLVQMFAGKGNNGGDVFAAASYLAEAGVEVEVFFAGRCEDVSGDALAWLKRMLDDEIELRELKSEAEWRQLQTMTYLAGDILVDGLLGTGISGAARGVAAAAIDVINTFADAKLSRVLAVDIPSGMNADTGKADGVVVRADVTITMGLPKRGLLMPEAVENVGNLQVVDIGIPSEYRDPLSTDVELIERGELRSVFGRRRRVSHKGDYGHVLLIGGAPGYAGAIGLAARAALRSGVGLVSLLVPESVASTVAVMVPAAMVHSGRASDSGSLAADAPKRVNIDLNRFDAVLLGPGMTRHKDGFDIIAGVAANTSCPLILDADALNLLAEQPELADGLKGRLVLTPHPGEMARLLGIDSAAVQNDRFAAARDAAARFGACVVLKGAGTIVTQPGGIPHVNMTGNPGMACGGTGDVLAGFMTGLAGQGHDLFTAARSAVYIHGVAGDRAAAELSQAGMTSEDLVDAIPSALVAETT